jgi:hypothetical protein
LIIDKEPDLADFAVWLLAATLLIIGIIEVNSVSKTVLSITVCISGLESSFSQDANVNTRIITEKNKVYDSEICFKIFDFMFL